MVISKRRRLEIDRAQTANVVWAKGSRNVNFRRADISGFDTKDSRIVKQSRVFIGPRGGNFVIRRRKKVYV